MAEGKSPFEKKSQSRLIIFPEMFPHLDKNSWGISYEYLRGWPKPTEEEIIRLCLCHTIFIFFKVVCITTKKTVSIPTFYS